MSDRELVAALLAEASPAEGGETWIGSEDAAALVVGALVRRHGRVTVGWRDLESGRGRRVEFVRAGERNAPRDAY